MKIVETKNFIGSSDLMVTLLCEECNHKVTMLVPADIWEREHAAGCMLFEKDEYLKEWAFSRVCPECGAVDDDDSQIHHCECETAGAIEVFKRMTEEALTRAQDSGYGDMCGWLYSCEYEELGIMLNNKVAASISLNKSAERNGEPYAELKLKIEKRNKKTHIFETVYEEYVELEDDTDAEEYYKIVERLKLVAEKKMIGIMSKRKKVS